MSRQARIMGLSAAIEGTYGTDATPDPSTNAILCKGLSPSPYQGNTVSRDLVKPTLGGEESINVNPYSTLSFEVELAGSGAAGTAPAVGVLLRACGMAETVTPSTDVVYEPVSTGFESATLYVYLDGELHKMLGARGSFSVGVNAQGIPMISFNFTGLYSTPASVTMPTFDYSSFIAPLPVTPDNTPTFSVLGHNAIAQSLSADMGLNVAARALIGSKEVVITDRNATGSLTIDAPTLATKNFYSAIESHNAVTTGALQVVHGTTGGNVVQIDAPKVQLSSISSTESEGVMQYSMNVNYIPTDAGDDEIKLTFK